MLWRAYQCSPVNLQASQQAKCFAFFDLQWQIIARYLQADSPCILLWSLLVGSASSLARGSPLTCCSHTQMTSKLVHYHEEYGGRNDRTALVWLVHQNPGDYLPRVRPGLALPANDFH